MILSKMSVHYGLFCVFVIALFLCVDYLSSSLNNSPENKPLLVLMDTSCHALLSGAVWFATSRILDNDAIHSFRQKDCRSGCNSNYRVASPLLAWGVCNYDLFLSLFFGSAVDADHFIAAGALSLSAATHLESRPWGHCLLCGVIVSFLVGVLTQWIHRLLKNIHAKTITAPATIFSFMDIDMSLLVFTAYLVHLLRDSVRRGLWFINVPIYLGDNRSYYWVISTPSLPVEVVLLLYVALPVLLHRFVKHQGARCCSFSSSSHSTGSEGATDIDFKSNV